MGLGQVLANPYDPAKLLTKLILAGASSICRHAKRRPGLRLDLVPLFRFLRHCVDAESPGVDVGPMQASPTPTRSRRCCSRSALSISETVREQSTMLSQRTKRELFPPNDAVVQTAGSRARPPRLLNACATLTVAAREVRRTGQCTGPRLRRLRYAGHCGIGHQPQSPVRVPSASIRGDLCRRQ